MIKYLPANAKDSRDMDSIPGLAKKPWGRKWQPTLILSPRQFHGWRILAGYSPRGHKESDTTKQLHFLTRNDLKLLIEIIAHSFFNVEEVGVIKQ